MRRFRFYNHTEKVGVATEAKGLRCWCRPRSGRHSPRSAERRTNVCRGTASREAVPGEVWHRRVARCDSTVQSEQPSPVSGCGTPVATAPPRTVSRVQACVATNRDILLRPDLGEGRNKVLKRGRCASWCLSPLMVEMALQGESRSRGASLLPP